MIDDVNQIDVTDFKVVSLLRLNDGGMFNFCAPGKQTNHRRVESRIVPTFAQAINDEIAGGVDSLAVDRMICHFQYQDVIILVDGGGPDEYTRAFVDVEVKAQQRKMKHVVCI